MAELRVAIDPGGAANDLLIVLVLAMLVPGAFVIGMALHSDARVVRLWLRHFDAEPVMWETCASGTRWPHVVLTGQQGRMPIVHPWRKRVLARTAGHLLFAGDFRTGGVVITADLRRIKQVTPVQLLPYAELRPWIEQPRNTSFRITGRFPPPVVDALTTAAEDRGYPRPNGYTPPEIVRLAQQNHKGKDLDDWRMDSTGIHLEGSVPATVTWGQLREVAFIGEQLLGLLHDPDDVTGWPMASASTPLHPGYVLLGVFYGAVKSSGDDFTRRFAADLEHFAGNANVRTLVPPTPLWIVREGLAPSTKKV
ncbi:hypothetical protein [Yinghuangia sp. YIM S10712]|uniref:hypothetical protein n=1 Tax=Yinghuangia sp. YIM S10712 TaxID=3436930 RepID=UPI003F531290